MSSFAQARFISDGCVGIVCILPVSAPREICDIFLEKWYHEFSMYIHTTGCPIILLE